MQTLYKNNIQEKTPIQIPTHIKSKVAERGFYVYNWIGSGDVKNSIERDFLKTLNVLGIPFAVIVIGGFLLTMNPFVSIGLSILLGLILFLYLCVLGFLRGIKLSKNAYIVLTDSSISINGKIFNKNDNSIITHIRNIENEFEEKLFEASQLELSKNDFIKKLKLKISDGYKKIFHNFRDKLLFIVLALYTVYVILMAGIYFFGSILIMFFGIFINIISRYILIKSGNEIMMIQDLFEKIHIQSEHIHHEKDQVLIALESAKLGDYKEGMVGDINSGIETISKKTLTIIELSKQLKQKLESSKYASIFNFGLYNNWIKKVTREPIEGLVSLLEKNKNDIKSYIFELQTQIQNTPDERVTASLSLQEKRLESQLQNIDVYIAQMKQSLEKIS